MHSRLARLRQLLMTAAIISTVSGCETGPRNGRPARSPSGAVASDQVEIGKLRAGAEADASYFRERAQALGTEALDQVQQTNFRRFRRGALYALGIVDSASNKALQRELGAALEKQDFSTIIDITAKILAVDQADIRSHILRALALDKLDRPKEAVFHREVAVSMLASIMRTGDGRGVSTAWTVYRVKEEYDVAKMLGASVESQALEEHGARRFDVLSVREVKSNATARAYFDVTEVMAEEQKSLGL